MAVWMPAARQPRSTASAKSACIVTSPPVSVTPPPECAKNGFMRTARRTTSPAGTRYPLIGQRPCGMQRSTQRPQASHRSRRMTWPAPLSSWTPCGHASTQAPQAAQRSATKMSSGAAPRDSGLWHHAHASGQPFR